MWQIGRDAHGWVGGDIKTTNSAPTSEAQHEGVYQLVRPAK
jgi:hypothetical protein